MVIKGNTVSGNRGTASDGATSAAVQVTSAVEPTGTEVTVTGNTFLENYDGVKVGDASATQPDDSKVTVTGNRIVGSVHAAVAVARPAEGPLVMAENNWFGCNEGPGAPGCDTVTDSVDADPWLVFGFSPAPPASMAPGDGAQFGVTTLLHPDGSPAPVGSPSGEVTFSATGGEVEPTSGALVGGAFGPVTFTAGPTPLAAGPEGTALAQGSGGATVTATLDNATITQTVTVVSPSPGKEQPGKDTPLPNTGTRWAAALVAGVVLVVAGGLLLWLARRRPWWHLVR